MGLGAFVRSTHPTLESRLMPDSPSGVTLSTGPLASTNLWVSPCSLPGMRMCGTHTSDCAPGIAIHWSFLLWTCCNHHATWRFAIPGSRPLTLVDAGWTAFSSPEVMQSLSQSILATNVVVKRQHVFLSLGPITSCALHNRFRSPWLHREGPNGGLFLLSGIGHSALLQWSARLDALLRGPLPTEASQSPIVDDIFNSLLIILRHHAPSQRQHPRRRQPVWWTPECFEACVTWRDFRRTQDPRDRSRFCSARTHFHRIVRNCQDSFWSHWQDRVSNLSRVNPRAAAREVRHGPGSVQGRSRRDQTHCVRWPEEQDPLEQWRQHFMFVGARSSSSFDPSFHADVMRRFADLSTLPPAPRVLDSSFTTSELRRALCVDSAVGLDGLPYSLYKVVFPWWQSALVKLFNLVLTWATVLGSTALLSPFSSKVTYQAQVTTVQCLWHPVASRCWSI